ncbi:NAD(P)-dependent oxidoreductase [Actinoplanes sp. NBRC 103695]|uniref:NAD(P)-dependent oxidoreductase n=1 Tax=Actinoplanes sp. NBRC 103695 TaxID=3032202 RepID=UPI0024A28C21|nr:NAD(P)-dependent oxidoreductase [Actinoplanes sp. NBRC 103695]GLY98599.1 NAD-dependent L-serine dehydrogenase [Actinoplanes sp. NBRC 103695]
MRIGFAGLGNMGGRMASCVVRAEQEVLGFDVRPENVTAASAKPAGSIGELTDGSDILLLSLPDSTVVEAVVLGDDGVLAHARPGLLVVDLSTASPDSTVRINGLLAGRGAAYLDAGISGGAAAAEKGALTLMVGGDTDALEQARPVLDLFSANIFHCGPTGAGHTVKLLNNFLNATALSATAEVMVAGKKAGIDLETLLAVLNASSGVNFATLNRFPKIIHGDYLKGGLTNSLMLKDVNLYVELAARLGVASLNAAGPVASFGMARALGYADEISNTVVDAIGDLSGGVRLHTREEPGA